MDVGLTDGAVLGECGASLTCSVTWNGLVEWFLTLESGSLPVCQNRVRCGCDADGAGMRLHRAYVVLKVATWDESKWRHFIVLAFISRETICIVERIAKVYDDMLRGSGDWRTVTDATREGFRALDDGAFSLREECRCTFGVVCRRCSAVSVTRRRFVRVVRYLGVRPLGLRFWFHGVTDAVGMMWPAEKPWLRCLWDR